MSVLLDTVVLIDIMRRDTRAVSTVANLPNPPSYCDVTVAELYAGARSQREEADIEALLRRFQRAAIGSEMFRRAGTFLKQYRNSHSTEFADALIAATAEIHGLRLATLNVKHFPMFPKLKVAY